MAGHSKWANIQHRKKKQDAKRGKLFTRLIREITVAARMGGGDVGSNPRLRLAVDTGLAANMPKDTVERAIRRGSGDQEGSQYEEVTYEGYGPGGIAVLVECMTDNRNRTVAEVRHAFSKSGGNLGTTGSVAFQFRHMGVLFYPPGTDEERVMEAALEAGAEDVVNNDDDSIEVLTSPDTFQTVREAMLRAGLRPEIAEVTMRADSSTLLSGEDAAKMNRLLEMLEDLDDTQNVYSNADIVDEELEED
jgi:YebC/PmpR family DNA-binding regulatory protein